MAYSQEQYDALNQQLDYELSNKRRSRLHDGSRNYSDIDNIRPEDIPDILPDYLRAHLSRGNPEKYHPFVSGILRDRWSLGDLQTRSGMTMSDFGDSMGDSLSLMLVERFTPWTNEFTKFSRRWDVQDYRPQSMVGIGLLEPSEIAEDEPLPSVYAGVTEGTRQGRLRSFGGTLRFSRAAWSCNSTEITEAVENYANIFAQVEAKIVAETLESGLIATAAGSLTEFHLSNAAKNLRAVPNAAGQPCGLEIHCIMVPSTMEIAARQLQALMNGWPRNIVVNPFLADGSFYCFADPAISAPLLRLQLRGLGKPRVFSDFSEYNHIKFAVTHDVDYVLTPDVPAVVVSP